MFYIKINNQALDLPENFEFTTTFENRMFEIDSFDILYSTPFEFPNTTHNRKLLDFPANLQNQLNGFIDRQAFLYQNETLLEKGILRIESYGDGSYKANFRGQISNLEKYKDATLQSILGNLMYDFGRYTSDEESFHNPIEDFKKVVVDVANTDKKSPLCFPFVKINNIIYNAYDFQTKTFIAFFKLNHILKTVLQKIGYELNEDYLKSCPDFERLILANTKLLAATNKGFSETYEELAGNGSEYAWSWSAITDNVFIDRYLKIADNIPTMKFREFLVAIQSLFAIDFDFDHIYQTVKMNFFRDIFANPAQKDWTSKAEPCQNVEGNDYEGYKFSFKQDSADTEQKDLLDAIPSKTIIEVNKESDILDNDPALRGKFYYAKREKKYYQIAEKYYGLNAEKKSILRFPSEYVADEFFDFVKDAGGKTIETAFQPIRMAKNVDIAWKNKVTVFQSPFSTLLPLCFVDDKAVEFCRKTNYLATDLVNGFFPRKTFYALFKSSEILMPNVWVEIAKIALLDPNFPDSKQYLMFSYPMDQNNATDIYGELLNSNFEVKDLDIILRANLEYYLPSFAAQIAENEKNTRPKPSYLSVTNLAQNNFFLTNKAISAEPTENPARILLFHNLQIIEYQDFANGVQRTQQALIPYASPDNTAPNGAKISEFALRWNKADNLIDTFWLAFLKFQKNKKTAEFTLRLHPNDLKNFRKTDKIRIDDVLFFVKKMEKFYDKSGLKKTVCTLESIANGICEHHVSLDIYETAQVKQVLISKLVFSD
jgi:hypothetical protein